MKLFARHQRAIYALIRSFCLRPQDADDIFQETFMVAWRKREEFEPGSNFLAWVAAIARFEALAHARHEGRESVLFDDAVLEVLTAHTASRNETPSDRLQALRSCLETLSDNQRTLIKQRYATGGTVKELASQLGRSANSMSVTLHAIRRKLLDCIDRKLAGEAS